MSLLEMMSESEFFRSTPPVILHLLEPIARERDFAPGVQIFAEGLKHPEIHIVLHGHVRLVMLIPRRGGTPILSVGSGEILGWTPLLSDSEMTATAVAVDSVKTLAFPADKLRELCESNHEIGFHFMKRLATAIAHRLTATRLQLLDLYKEHTPATSATLTSIKPGDEEC